MLGAYLTQLEQMAGQRDVDNTLEQIAPICTITDSEKTELDGESATYYSIEQEMNQILEQQGTAMGLNDEEIAEPHEQMPETLRTELWWDEQQRPMQLVVEIEPFPESLGGPAVDISGPMTMHYTDWGIEIDVEEPPENDVADAEKILPSSSRTTPHRRPSPEFPGYPFAAPGRVETASAATHRAESARNRGIRCTNTSS